MKPQWHSRHFQKKQENYKFARKTTNGKKTNNN